jgi:hypothetical protein
VWNIPWKRLTALAEAMAVQRCRSWRDPKWREASEKASSSTLTSRVERWASRMAAASASE